MYRTRLRSRFTSSHAVHRDASIDFCCNLIDGKTSGASMSVSTMSCGSVCAAVILAAAVLAACNQQQTETKSAPPYPARLATVATNDIGKTPDLQQAAMTMGKDV